MALLDITVLGHPILRKETTPVETITVPSPPCTCGRSSLASRTVGRIGSIDEVAAAVVFLASPAASLVTGTSLLVDGGYTAQ